MLIDGIGYFLFLLAFLGMVAWPLLRWPTSRLRNMLRWTTITARDIGYLLSLVAMSSLLVGFFLRDYSVLVEELYIAIAVNFITIAITVLFIDVLNQRRLQEQEKIELILQLGSPDLGFAVEAARRLFRHGWLTDGSVRGAVLHRTNLSRADLEGADFANCGFSQARFRRCQLNYANFSGAYLASSDLSEAHLVEANFSEAMLYNANLFRAILAGANLTNADLEAANLSAANLVSANLAGAVLTNANLDEAQYDENTIWPDDFCIEASGALRIEQ